LKRWFKIWGIVSATFVASVGTAPADETVLTKLQWLSENAHEANIMSYRKNADGKFRGIAGFNFDERTSASDFFTHKCIDLLDRVTHYPLKKMMEIGYLSAEDYAFYRGLSTSVDVRQISFFNLSTPKNIEYEVTHISLDPVDPLGLREQRARTLIENITAFGDDHLTDHEFSEAAKKHLQIDASLWIVRNFILNRNSELDFTKMPWQIEEKFKNIAPRNSRGLDFELGRTAKEISANISELLSAALLTATNDAHTLGYSLAESRLFIHSLDALHTRLYAKYGFKPVGEITNAAGKKEYLLAATLEDCFNLTDPGPRFEAIDQIATHSEKTKLGAYALRNRVRDAHFRIYEQTEWAGPDSPPLVIHYGSDAFAFLANDVWEMGVEKGGKVIATSLMISPDFFPGKKLGLSFMEATPRDMNFVYGASEAALKKDPNYLVKMVAGIYSAQIIRLNESIGAEIFGEQLVHQTPLAFVTKNPTIIAAGKSVGAEIRTIKRQYRTLKFRDHTPLHFEDEAQIVVFTPELQKRITAYYFRDGKIPSLREGYYEKRSRMLNPF